MIFFIVMVIVYIFSFILFKFGDVIVSGMLGGVGVKCIFLLWMKLGDIVIVEIGFMGMFSNIIVVE